MRQIAKVHQRLISLAQKRPACSKWMQGCDCPACSYANGIADAIDAVALMLDGEK